MLGGNQVGNLGYSYDADGRVTAKTGSFAQTNLPQAVTGNTFNAGNEMTGFNGTTLSYDLNGNLSGDGTNSYSWDARNHLASISGAVTASFIYDAFGRRVRKSINGSVTQFVFDGSKPVQELDGSSPPNTEANLLIGLKDSERFIRTDASGPMNFMSDAAGSTLTLADSTGAFQTQYTYDPFGNTTVSGTPSNNSYQFDAQENDDIGLYFFHGMFYDPSFGRFIAGEALDTSTPSPIPNPVATPSQIPTPGPTPTPGQGTVGCFIGKVGRDPFPILSCVLGGYACYQVPNRYFCDPAIIRCLDCAGQAASCYRNPGQLP